VRATIRPAAEVDNKNASARRFMAVSYRRRMAGPRGAGLQLRAMPRESRPRATNSAGVGTIENALGYWTLRWLA
jgi:hypothetical protein